MASSLSAGTRYLFWTVTLTSALPLTTLIESTWPTGAPAILTVSPSRSPARVIECAHQVIAAVEVDPGDLAADQERQGARHEEERDQADERGPALARLGVLLPGHLSCLPWAAWEASWRPAGRCRAECRTG